MSVFFFFFFFVTYLMIKTCYWIVQVDTREFLLRVSYMEIYNEEINDLLAPEAQKLQIHENVEVHKI